MNISNKPSEIKVPIQKCLSQCILFYAGNKQCNGLVTFVPNELMI